MNTTNINSSIARIENQFIFYAQYQLTAREQKIMLFLFSNINPLEPNFEVQVVSLKDLKEVILNKRSGSFYDQMMDFAGRISKKQIVFDSNLKLEKRRMQGFINWFQSIIPVHNDAGELCLQFKFSEDLKPHLLELKEYTQINYLETMSLKSSYSIRMYQVFRAYRDKMAKYQKHSKLNYQLTALKSLLGIEDKYKAWRDLNRYVIAVIEKEINKETDIKLKATPVREGRKVAAIEFEFWDKGSRSKATAITSEKPSLENLSFAQSKAIQQLIAYGITTDIALEMLNRVGGSEIVGFEDWYFESIISIFESKTKQEGEAAKAGTLVNWFLKKKIFEQGDHFAKVMEQLQTRKKKLQTDRPTAWDNRLLAKTMTSTEFTKRFKEKG